MAQLIKLCDSLPHSVTIACFSWLIVVKMSTLTDYLLKAPKQHRQPDLSPGCLGETESA